MKKNAFRKVNIIIAAVVILAFAAVMVIRSGVFTKTPVAEVKPMYFENGRTLTVITDADYNPYSFYAEDGTFTGYDVELITIIANELGMNLDLRPEDWSAAIKDMETGKADVLMTCDYSDSFAGVESLPKSLPTSSDEFIVYSKHRISSVDELYGKKGAVMENGNVTPLMKELGLDQDWELCSDNRAAMQMLITDEKVDYAVMRQAVGITLLKELGGSGVEGYISIGQSLMCFGIRNDDNELREEINGVIRRLRQNGEMERLHDKWLTTFVRPYTVKEVIENNIWIVFAFVILLAVTLGAIYKNRMREAKNREEQAAKDQVMNKQLEEALAVAQTANEYKTEFLFNMSHDIRTPMNAIMGYTDIGLRYSDDAGMAKDNFRKIKTAGGHLLSLINDILEMSRIESGNLVLTEAPCDVRLSVASVEHMSKALAISKDIDFEAKMGDIPDPYIYADELHMNEVLINLVSNAVKYTHNGGWVRYEISQLGGVKDGKVTYRFEIKDNGIGMSEEFQQHLFEAFTREENATVLQTEGAGLGLSIVKKILDLAGGTIRVYSAPNVGTSFVVEIPFRVMSREDIEKFRAEHVNVEEISGEYELNGKRVLLVEDNEMNREIGNEILSEAGMEVETAEDGRIAANMVAEKGPGYYDFILMDIQMPVMNGYESTRAIRSLPEGKSIPIIAVSANAFEEDRQKSLKSGMNAHIAKPIDVKVLFSTMRDLKQ